VCIFGSVWFLSKKSNQTEFFFLKKPKPVQNDQFRFGFLEQKPVQTGLAQFFPVWLGFDSVWLGFFGFRLKNQNRTEPVGFFKILIGFFSQFGFFGYFFPGFLGIISFLIFLNTRNNHRSYIWELAFSSLIMFKIYFFSFFFFVFFFIHRFSVLKHWSNSWNRDTRMNTCSRIRHWRHWSFPNSRVVAILISPGSYLCFIAWQLQNVRCMPSVHYKDSYQNKYGTRILACTWSLAYVFSSL